MCILGDGFLVALCKVWERVEFLWLRKALGWKRGMRMNWERRVHVNDFTWTGSVALRERSLRSDQRCTYLSLAQQKQEYDFIPTSSGFLSLLVPVCATAVQSSSD